MVKVVFAGELQRSTGTEEVELAVGSYRELVCELVAQYGLDRDQLIGMAVAIDGLIIHDPLLEKLNHGSEVHFLHRISGG